MCCPTGRGSSERSSLPLLSGKLLPKFRLAALPTRCSAVLPSCPPALLRFDDAREALNGRVLLRFSVAGLADISLIYLANQRGRLLKAFVDDP